LKKHGPPLHGDCLALIAPVLGKLAEELEGDDVEPDDDEQAGDLIPGDEQTQANNAAVAYVLQVTQNAAGTYGPVTAQLKRLPYLA
jgi:hypothetical protein